ncbi:MAG TPA: hypothetical protein VFQ59_00055, partial [Candidatus Paceibacterota bacterium]|nr:hypothetical protein [Candidatus Paceibacterota bacterium]
MQKYFSLQNIILQKTIAGILVFSIVASTAFLHSPTVALSAFNKEINYQGKLTNALGIAVPNASYNMQFKLYTVSTGGTAIWTETRIDANKVTVSNGLFSVMLGEVTSLASIDFNQALYLGVNIGGSGSPSWDGEMTPRKKLGAVPAAVVAESANSAINILGGTAGSIAYQSAIDTTAFSSAGTVGQALVSGGTGSPTWFAPTAGSLVFAGASGILAQDNANLFWDDATKRLGIGTTAPQMRLEAFGTGGLPATSGTTPTGSLRISNPSTSRVLDFGADSGNGTWIQATLSGNLASTSNLLINPNGGQVGIGVTNASVTLDVSSSTGTGTAKFVSTGTGPSTDVLIVDKDNLNTRAALQIQGNAGATEILFASSTGNVGIGTTAPAYPLDVLGNIGLSGNIIDADGGGNADLRISGTTASRYLN